MHRVRRAEVFPPGGPPVVAERYELRNGAALHSHDFIELAVVTGGTATHVSAAGERELDRGSVTMLRPGDWHGYQDCRRLVVHNLYVGPEVFQRELAWLRADPQLGRILHDAGRSGHPLRLDPTTQRIVDTGLTAITDRPRPEPPPAVLVGMLLCLLGGTAASLPADPAGRNHPAVTAAAQLLENDIQRAWTLSELAAAVTTSPAYLARLFTAQLGVPPMTYLGRLRAERAAALLIETDLPVAAVGRLVGWNDPNYASRRFRHFFAFSPAAYRTRFGRV
ncbi:helix-turn-helix transcriptional regulator [Actinomadura madurae]|uniref:helix-turn-helix transcriptional regulator n=1 Tax=Actinomadura madurae TaxID=1993 RepID=UPI0020D207EF|nr:AraC family transcriptional regulator [Actinomadura madurae]MCP9947096.1 AraC family transcriptional regulator [Actinomadura madurae]MCQ0012176.1 AraC family transcriptional regulator [Actinomadura madurae]